jgi:hypothetical protein
MKKIITTLTAVTFALGLAAAAQAQVGKTPEKPAVQTQTVQPQVAPKAADPVAKEAVKPGEPVVKETVKPGDKTKEAVPTGDKTKKVTKYGDKGKVKKDAEKVAPKATMEKKAGAPMEKTPEGAK